MKYLVLLMCIALYTHEAIARPQVAVGYTYNQGQTDDFNIINPSAITTSYQPTASGTGYFNTVPAIGQISTVGTIGGSNSVSSGFIGSGSQSSSSSLQSSSSSSSSSSSTNSFNGVNNGIGVSDNNVFNTFNPAPPFGDESSSQYNANTNTNNYEEEAYLSHLQNFQPTIVHKNFYLYSAPVEHQSQEIVRHITIGRPQKNYKVVFINAPSSTASRARIIANVAPTEEKTAIYVLSKKTNELDVNAEVVTQPSIQHKPDVFFVKYKTPEEAQHAQQVIQGQYDVLGGTTNTEINQGLIPVSSVIGTLNQHAGEFNNADQTQVDGSTLPLPPATVQIAQKYLPANHK